ncbi:uncharacterized protein LOC131694909 [Topomyia yanbarensis]|uniref:uncharacterized protein LOC131694753 n=1 Tax=Topomyia yanbarensis TaxID=2498891 RepID=UPI00273AF8BA|nr:uncharacterized protein LOC131694753 [Topomyia yanbarensis]XP_058839408.1 uncharacterized protein LOC131694909 [Topomyia yanbarensis]
MVEEDEECSLTTSFSQKLLVIDSDETEHEISGSSSNTNISRDHQQAAIIDLTALSSSDTSPANALKHTTEAELTDSWTFEEPPKSSQSFQTTNERLNFVDNIPEPIQRNRNSMRSNVSCAEGVSTDETRSPSIDSLSSCSEEYNDRNSNRKILESFKNLKVNISAKININIRFAETCNDTSLESNEEDSFEIRRALNRRKSPAEDVFFINEGMANILTDIYGSKWQTYRMKKYCHPSSEHVAESNDMCFYK